MSHKKESLKSDCHQFHQYQLSEQPLRWKCRPWHGAGTEKLEG